MLANHTSGQNKQILLAIAAHGLTVAGIVTIALAFVIPGAEVISVILPGAHDLVFLLSFLVCFLSCVNATVDIRAGMNTEEIQNWRSWVLWSNVIAGVCHQLAFCAYIVEYAFINFSNRYGILCVGLKIFIAASLLGLDCYSLMIVKKYLVPKARVGGWHSTEGYAILAEHNAINLTHLDNASANGSSTDGFVNSNFSVPPQNYGTNLHTDLANRADAPSAPPAPPPAYTPVSF